MSQLEVDKVIPQSGTTLTLGDSADTITIPSGATLDASSATLTLPDGSVTSAKISYPLTAFSSTGIDDDGTSTAITINSSNNVALAGNIGLGGATPTTSGTGITFPATASASTDANTLDDYEEGLHTVTATDTGGGATIVLNTSYDQLAYTKIGRVVHIQGVLLFSSITGAFTGTLQISLPFTSANLTDLAGRTVMGLGTYNVDFTSGTSPYLNVSEGSANATIQVSADNVAGGEGRPQASAQLYIGGSYITDT